MTEDWWWTLEWCLGSPQGKANNLQPVQQLCVFFLLYISLQQPVCLICFFALAPFWLGKKCWGWNLRSSVWQAECCLCLSWGFCCCDKISWPKQVGHLRVPFYSPLSKELRAGTWGWKWSRNSRGTGLLPRACSVCSLCTPRPPA